MLNVLAEVSAGGRVRQIRANTPETVQTTMRVSGGIGRARTIPNARAGMGGATVRVPGGRSRRRNAVRVRNFDGGEGRNADLVMN